MSLLSYFQGWIRKPQFLSLPHFQGWYTLQQQQPPPLLPPTIAPPTYSHVTRNPGQCRRQAAKAKKSSLARSALGRSSFPNKNTTFPILHLLMILPMMKLFLLLIQ